jgi:Uncharacterized protein conserved in bacteria
MSKEARTELPVRSFASEAAFEKWLQTNHTHSPGLWLRFFKKSATRKALAHKGALDVALCYGWIDGQLKEFDIVHICTNSRRAARGVSGQGWIESMSSVWQKKAGCGLRDLRLSPLRRKTDGGIRPTILRATWRYQWTFWKHLPKTSRQKHFSIRSIGRIATRSRGDCKRRRSPRLGKREWRRLSQCSGKKRSSTNPAEIRTEHPKLYRHISCHIEIVRK